MSEEKRTSRFLTADEVADRLRQKPRTITAWAAAYKESGGTEGLPGRKVGRRWLFEESAIEAIMEKRSDPKTA